MPNFEVHSNESVCRRSGRLGLDLVYIRGHRFENIIAALSFKDLPLPSFKERLFEVFQMIIVCYQHMKDVFIP